MDPLQRKPSKTWPSAADVAIVSRWIRQPFCTGSKVAARKPGLRRAARGQSENGEQRLTPPRARLYCAPSHLKRVFRDFTFIDGVQKRVILGSSPEAFVALGHSLKI